MKRVPPVRILPELTERAETIGPEYSSEVTMHSTTRLLSGSS